MTTNISKLAYTLNDCDFYIQRYTNINHGRVTYILFILSMNFPMFVSYTPTKINQISKYSLYKIS